MAKIDYETYPEILAFEIDNDVNVRGIQADVTFAMLENDNRLVQLNMGDGKTHIIMPLVLTLSSASGCGNLEGKKTDSCANLVRATVLSSLYATNTADWQWKLGGILGRRIYPMICRRDLPIDKERSAHWLELCKLIREQGHIIVTVPEHRLSLENKVIEFASKH